MGTEGYDLMARNEIYHIHPKTTDTGFEVLKGDKDLNPTGKYTVDISGRFCDCFAGNKSTCRHRQMVDMWRSPERLADETCTFREKMEAGFWYEFDKRRWVKGITEE